MTVKEFNNMDGRTKGTFEIDGVVLKDYLVRDILSDRIIGDMSTLWENICEDDSEATIEEFLYDVDIDLNCMMPSVTLVPTSTVYAVTIEDVFCDSETTYCFDTEEEADGCVEYYKRLKKRTDRKHWYLNAHDRYKIVKEVF